MFGRGGFAMALKIVRDELTLVYGLRLFNGRAAAGGAHMHATFRGFDGADEDLALHTMSGTRDEIRAQLMQSIDAFFELVDASD
jgi:hypothetical protein